VYVIYYRAHRVHREIQKLNLSADYADYRRFKKLILSAKHDDYCRGPKVGNNIKSERKTIVFYLM
jgi:hypothetical protein